MQSEKRKGKNEEARNKILQEIKDKGYETQNQLLMEMGYNSLNKNRKMLVETKGNVEKILELLKNSKKTKKESDDNEDNENSCNIKGKNRGQRRFNNNRNKKEESSPEKIQQNQVSEDEDENEDGHDIDIKQPNDIEELEEEKVEVIDDALLASRLSKESEERDLKSDKKIKAELEIDSKRKKGPREERKNGGRKNKFQNKPEDSQQSLEKNDQNILRDPINSKHKNTQELFKIKLSNFIAPNIKKLVVDGTDVIQQSQTKISADAELSLCIATKYWLTRTDVLMIFTNSKISQKGELVKSGKTYNFEVTNGPTKESVGEILNKILRNNGDEIQDTLFVTSDGEIQQILAKNGAVNFMASETWLSHIKKSSSNDLLNALLGQ